MELLGNLGWWMASWQHGLSRGLGFCSYRPLFIPRCQSLYRNQLINPASPFLPLFPPFLPPQSSLLSLSWCEGSLPSIGGKLSWSRSDTVRTGVSRCPREAGCGCPRRGGSTVPDHGPSATLAVRRLQLHCPSWIIGSAWIGRTFLKSCQALAGVLSG